MGRQLTGPATDFVGTHARDPYQVPRRELLREWQRLSTNLQRAATHAHPLINEDVQHTAPVGTMGDYFSYLRQLDAEQPFRSALDDEDTPPAEFGGNPFRLSRGAARGANMDDAMVGSDAGEMLPPSVSPQVAPRLCLAPPTSDSAPLPPGRPRADAWPAPVVRRRSFCNNKLCLPSSSNGRQRAYLIFLMFGCSFNQIRGRIRVPSAHRA